MLSWLIANISIPSSRHYIYIYIFSTHQEAKTIMPFSPSYLEPEAKALLAKTGNLNTTNTYSVK